MMDQVAYNSLLAYVRCGKTVQGYTTIPYELRFVWLRSWTTLPLVLCRIFPQYTAPILHAFSGRTWTRTDASELPGLGGLPLMFHQIEVNSMITQSPSPLLFHDLLRFNS